jgi:hypothetical protein
MSRARSMAQVVEHLSSSHKTLRSREREREREREKREEERRGGDRRGGKRRGERTWAPVAHTPIFLAIWEA